MSYVLDKEVVVDGCITETSTDDGVTITTSGMQSTAGDKITTEYIVQVENKSGAEITGVTLSCDENGTGQWDDVLIDAKLGAENTASYTYTIEEVVSDPVKFTLSYSKDSDNKEVVVDGCITKTNTGDGVAIATSGMKSTDGDKVTTEYIVQVENKSGAEITGVTLSCDENGTQWNSGLTDGDKLSNNATASYTYTLDESVSDPFDPVKFTLSYCPGGKEIAASGVIAGNDKANSGDGITVTANGVENQNETVYTVQVDKSDNTSIWGAALTCSNPSGKWGNETSGPTLNIGQLTSQNAPYTYTYTITGGDVRNVNFELTYDEPVYDTLYAQKIMIRGTEVTGTETTENINISAYAMKVQNENSSAHTLYTVNISNNSGNDIPAATLSCTSNNGEWTSRLQNATLPAAGGIYTYKVNDIASTPLNFTLSYNKTVQKSGSATGTSIDTTTIDTSASAVAGSYSSDPIQLKLTPEKINYLANGNAQVRYTLSMKNNVSVTNPVTDARVTIPVSGILASIGGVSQAITWDTTSDIVLKRGEEKVLTGTVELAPGDENASYKKAYELKVTVTPSEQTDIYGNTKYYTYVGDVTGQAQTGNVSLNNDSTPGAADCYSGNHLYIGGIVGNSKGTITEIKQDVDLIGNAASGAEPENGALIKTGGIAGNAVSGALSDLYLLGTADGNAAYTGEGSVTVSDSVNSSSGTKPDNSRWSAYTRYESDGSGGSTAKTYFDLAWLVKKESANETYFTYDTPAQDKVNVTISSHSPVSSYAIAYNARKAITDASEDTIYLTANTGANPALDLGSSGFYRILSAYATDGYYHYCTDAKALEDAAFVYPYDTKGYKDIFFDSTLTWDTKSIDNKIVVKVFPTSALGMDVYYEKNGNGIPSNAANKLTIDAEGKILLDFTEEQVSYRLVLVADGRIYLTSEQKSFDSSDRKPLPKPVVTYQSGYKMSGIEEYQPFTSGIVLQSGQKLKISMENDVSNYNFQYLLSPAVLGAEVDWDEDDGRYIGMNAALLSGAQNYNGTVSLSDNGTYYLYVKVSRKNYKDAIYRYGQLTVTDAVELTSSIYYTKNDLSDIQNEGVVVDGDLMKLQCRGDSYDLKYEISSSHKTDNFTWTSYEKDSFIPLKQEGKPAVYVYVAACKDDHSLERIQEFHYTFADSCLPVSVTPNTGQETEGDTGAAPVESGSTVKLSTRTENARILYARPGSSTDFTLERVTDLPSGVQDEEVKGGYRYYQAGSRWYRTSLTDMQVYSSEIILSNIEATLMRIYAVVLKDGCKPAEERKYIYSVAAQQQVTAPEASLKTRKAEDADNVAATKVELGSSLLFSCMTPGVTLYYRLPGESVWTEIPVSGVVVNGKYDARYTISVKAEKEGMLDSAVVTYEYVIASQEAVMAPTAIPATATDAPAVVMPGSKILLSSLTKGAMIYYTLDGSSPRLTENEDGSYQAAEGTMLYESEKGIVVPEGHSGLFTVCAVAVKSGLAKSEEVHLVYTFPDAVVTPYANISQGYVALDTEVHLMNKTEDAVIYYTVAYGDEVPEEPTLSSAIYDDTYPFVITKKTTIRAFAAKGGVKSSILELTYLPMEELSVPVPSIESGSIVSRGTVLTLKAADGATVYYTMDGSDPLDSANKAVVSGTTIALNGEAGSQITIKAYAAADDKSASEVVTFTYQFSQSAGGVTADVESGSLVSNGTKVNLMTDVSGAEIHYTTDGSSPAESGIKGTTVTITGVPGTSFTIKAVAVIDGEAGVVAAFTYKIKEVPNAPTAAPAGGTLTVAARVTLSSGSEKIYYTTDGTTPTESSSLYSEPILINRTTTLKAIAVSKDGEISEVADWQYVAAAKAEAPSANLADMSVLEPGTIVLLRTNTPDAEIYYSTDGTVPSLTNLDDMLLYQEDGITISRSVTIKAVSYREDLQLSNVGVWNYVVEKIPAVEIRVQKEAKLAEEELRDTDSSGLDRDKAVEGTTYKSRVLEDGSCGTVVSSDWESIAPQTKLAAEQVEISSATVNNVRKMFGEDHTVLVSYDMKLMNGSTYVKSNGDVEIGIPIPEGYENAVLTIASVDSEHRLKVCETRRSGDMLYASTDQMNQFVVIGVEELESEDTSSIYILDWFMAIYEKISAKW
ncbi:MAG: chitobiase/beta-hexosaminidase C-terminal domain-containing protein [Lachnospiraceae bacterium]|nr:chitobiase/beta-hexosaminidase C-terminal domain-containing protein [Lachnospiraceae bacterium]